MTLHHIAEIISLLATFPTIALAAYVLILWGRSAVDVLRRMYAEPDTIEASCWFILGVAVGFLGGLFDNFYWLIPWSCDFTRSEWREFWFSNGVYSNIPFRQLCGILAGYCHVRSAMIKRHGMDASSRTLNRVFCCSTLAGAAYVLALYSISS